MGEERLQKQGKQESGNNEVLRGRKLHERKKDNGKQKVTKAERQEGKTREG